MTIRETFKHYREHGFPHRSPRTPMVGTVTTPVACHVAGCTLRFSLPPSIRYGGAVRTRMPGVQIRFEGYLIRETAGWTLGMPPRLLKAQKLC